MSIVTKKKSSKKRYDSKGRILRTGEIQRKDGLYEYKYFDIHGKRKSVYSWKLVKTDRVPAGKKITPCLRDMESKIQEDVKDGIDTDKSNMTLNKLFSEMIDISQVAETTKAGYIENWNREILHSNIGTMKISTIRPMDIQKIYAGLAKRDLSSGTIKAYHTLINQSLRMAVENDIIRKNPAYRCFDEFKGEPKEVVPLTIEEQNNLLRFAQKSKIYSKQLNKIIYMIGTASRIGEFSGITWNDIDLENKVIDINHQLVYKKLDGKKTDFHARILKSQSGKRTIPIPDIVVETLVKHKEECLANPKPLIEIGGYSGFVFTTKSGMPIAPNGFNNMLDNLVNAYNKKERKIALIEDREPVLISHISSHVLRHTGCTRMAESGMDVKVLQYIMGHAHLDMTMEVYNYADKTRVKNEVTRINGSFIHLS